MQENTPDLNKLDKPFPLWFMLLIPIYVILILSAAIFPAAGDFRWIRGWIFVVTIAINLTISNMIINKKNPRVLRNRSRLRKTGLSKETKQSADSDRFIFPVMALGFLGAVILAALGHRFGWHTLSFAVSMIGVLIMNVGVAIMNIAILQNSFASKILDINKGQVLVDSGLYAHVRHPLYAGAILMALFIPIALGSLWGLLPALLSALMLVLRIEYEEEMLMKGMKGYQAYQSRVKYKLIPGIY